MTRALAIALLAGLVLAAAPAGTDPNSPTAAWFRSLKTPEGGSCCSLADCRATQIAPDGAGGLVAFLDAYGWVAIPPDKIQRREDNPTHHAVVCSAGRTIYCVVLEGGT